MTPDPIEAADWFSGPQWITLGVIVGVIAFLIAYDVLAYALWGNDATVTVVFWRLVTTMPLAAFLIGMAFGHLFWPRQIRNPPPPPDPPEDCR